MPRATFRHTLWPHPSELVLVGVGDSVAVGVGDGVVVGVCDGVKVGVGDGVAVGVGDGVTVGVGDDTAVGVGALVGAGVGESLILAKGVSAGCTVTPDGELSPHADTRTTDIEHSSQAPAAH